jgi:hypothetical protein
MTRVVARALLLISLIVSLGTICFSQPAAPHGTVTGSVTSSSGPVAGVKVVITSAVSAFTGTVISDQTGSFTFSGAPLGGVTVTALDSKGRTLATATGKLDSGGQVLSLPLKIS